MKDTTQTTTEHDRPPVRGEEGYGLYQYLLNQAKPTESDILDRLLAWNKKWPSSSLLMKPEDIKTAEIELDDIMMDAEGLCPKQ